MFKYLIALIAITLSTHAYANVNYNPSTGIYTVDQYGALYNNQKNKCKSPQNNQPLSPNNLGSSTIKILIK